MAEALAAPEVKGSFTVDQAAQCLDRSLASLKTDRIDLWLMHAASAGDLRDPGLLQFMNDTMAIGKIGSFGVGTQAHHIPRLVREHPDFCRVLRTSGP